MQVRLRNHFNNFKVRDAEHESYFKKPFCVFCANVIVSKSRKGLWKSDMNKHWPINHSTEFAEPVEQDDRQEMQIALLSPSQLHRQALQWVQQNIAGFGGDPTRVTISGESAGAGSVGAQLIAYNGRDDKLFRGVMAQSGSPLGFSVIGATEDTSTAYFTTLTEAVGCTNTTTMLSCLRAASVEAINAVPTQFNSFGPLPDGDIIAQSPLISLENGSFVHVPYIIGTNADEGTSFIPFGINTDEDLNAFLISLGLTSNETSHLMELYPNNAEDLVVAHHPEQFNDIIGLQWKRTATLITDISFLVGTRFFLDQYLAFSNTKVWTYLFNSIPNNVPDYYGVTHAIDLAYTFHNFEGVGWTDEGPPPFFGRNPFENVTASHKDVADLITRNFISFINALDPNYGASNSPYWPPVTSGNRTELVFDAVEGVHLQQYTFRKNGTDYIASLFVENAHAA